MVVTEALLSEHKMNILRLVVNGKMDREIADELHLSVDTIKTHVKQILHTLGAANRTQATALALKWGLVPPWDVEEPKKNAGWSET